MPFGETLIGDFAHRRYMKITAKGVPSQLAAVSRMVKIHPSNSQKTTSVLTVPANPKPFGKIKT